MLKQIFDFIKRDILLYPSDNIPMRIPSGIVFYSPESSEEGVSDNQNKLIVIMSFDQFGNIKKTIKPYSPERVFALENENKIPVYDGTQKEERFPIFDRALPQEISYATK